MNNLVSFGIIRKIEVTNKKKFVYKLVSPLARIFYYADEKYNIAERPRDEKELLAIIQEVLPHMIEDAVREHIAKKEGLRETIIESRDYDIDGYLMRFQEPEILLEVKWKRELKKEDIQKTEKNLEKLSAKRKILFVPDKKEIKTMLEVWDVDDL